MAESTPYVLAAGGIICANRILRKDADQLVLIGAATAAAALVTAGLDVIAPGLGKGLGILMVLGAGLREGPELMGYLPGGKPK